MVGARQWMILPSVAVAFTMVACTVPETPLPPGVRVPLVHAVLDLGATSHRISVAYTDVTEQDTTLYGSIVTVTSPSGVVMTAVGDSVPVLDPRRNKPTGAFRRVPFFVLTPSAFGVTLEPGETYSLKVITPAGDTVTGTTTIPFALQAPAAPLTRFSRNTDTLRLTWPPSPRVASYYLSFSTSFSRDTLREFFFQNFSRFSRSAVSYAGVAQDIDGQDLFPINSHVVASASAVDANFYDYYRTSSDPFSAAPPSRLVGGLGVFGSMVPVFRRRLDIVF
jgi:hypothetical protein